LIPRWADSTTTSGDLDIRLLIIGGSSCVGRNLIEAAPRSWDIRASYCNSPSFEAFAKGFPNTEAFHLDLIDPPIDMDLGSPDVVLYLSGVAPGRTADDVPLQLHAFGVNKVVTALQGIEKFIYLSSGVVYLKDNRSAYRISRALGEANVLGNALEKGFGYIILRNMEMYGRYMPEHKIYRKLAEACLRGDRKFRITGDGLNLLDTMHVRDYTEGLIKVIESDVTNEVVDYCKGTPVTLRELAATIAEVFNHSELHVVYNEESPTEDVRLRLSDRRMRELFDFAPRIGLEEGLGIWKREGLL